MSKKPIFEKNLAYLDIETTGLDFNQHEILQIAILIENVKTGKIEKVFETRVKPQNIETASEYALEVNGYKENPELWDDAPFLNKELADKIHDLLIDCVIVGHNVKFDISFLESQMRKLDAWGRIGHHAIDTATLAIEHLAHFHVSSVSLHNVCAFLGVSNEVEHEAMADVLRCRKVYKKLRRATWFHYFWWMLRNWK